MVAVFFTFSVLQAQNCATLLLEQQPVNTANKTITVKVSLTGYLGQIPTIPTNVDNITFSLEVYGTKPFGAVPMPLSISPMNNISSSGSLNQQSAIITYSMNPSTGTLSGNSTYLFDMIYTYNDISCDVTNTLVFKQGFLKEGSSTCPIYCAYSLPNAILEVTSPPCITYRSLGGAITTADNNACPVPDVNVAVIPNLGISTLPITTVSSGEYETKRLSKNNYIITPSKDDGYLCGISVLDLVLMSKHILNSQPLPNWWQLIAADINNSVTISTADLVELRKMILGIQSSFSLNKSWRFFDKSKAPQIKNENISVYLPNADVLNNGFFGVKIGDVSGNWCDSKGGGCAAPQKPEREEDLWLTDIAAHQGEEFDVVVRVGENQIPLAYSTGFIFDREAFDIVALIPSETVHLIEDNFSINEEEGTVKMLWTMENENPTVFRQGDELYKVRVRAKRDIPTLDGVVSLDENFENVAYDIEGEAKALKINFTGAQYRNSVEKSAATKQKSFASLDQAGKELSLNYYVSDEGNSKLSIYDLQGRLITQKNFYSNYGYNNIQVELFNQQQSEIYFYLLETPKFPISGKVFRISK